MSKIMPLVTFLAATSLFCHGTASIQTSSTLRTPEVTPAPLSRDTAWEQSFFSALEERLKQVKLPSLKTMTLDENDIEVRLWYDARPKAINGFLIHRLRGRWSAIGIRQTIDEWPSPVVQKNLGRPKPGWENLWKQLRDSGVLTLPDSSETKCHSEVLDGAALVVETSVSKVYKTYRYANPQLVDCDEAKRIMTIEAIIAKEFRL